jgi:DNA-binding transcriptional MerR regulator
MDSPLTDESRFTLRQVSVWTNLSEEMIDYLCRMEIVTPAVAGRRGRGRMREFEFADVVLLRTVKHLLDKGVSVKKVRNSLNNLREKFTEITPGQMPKRFICSDGNEVYLRTKKDVLAEISKSGQLTFSFVMNLDALHADVAKRKPASVA